MEEAKREAREPSKQALERVSKAMVSIGLFVCLITWTLAVPAVSSAGWEFSWFPPITFIGALSEAPALGAVAVAGGLLAIVGGVLGESE